MVEFCHMTDQSGNIHSFRAPQSTKFHVGEITKKTFNRQGGNRPLIYWGLGKGKNLHPRRNALHDGFISLNGHPLNEFRWRWKVIPVHLSSQKVEEILHVSQSLVYMYASLITGFIPVSHQVHEFGLLVVTILDQYCLHFFREEPLRNPDALSVQLIDDD